MGVKIARIAATRRIDNEVSTPAAALFPTQSARAEHYSVVPVMWGSSWGRAWGSIALWCAGCSGASSETADGSPSAPAPVVSPRGHATRVTDPGTACLPLFRSQGAWLAGDGGRSVPLANGKLVHVFGDTLIGPVDDGDRRPITFVGNTLGVAECDAEGWSIEYYWRDDGDERRAFFDVEGEHVWVSEAFSVGGRLYAIQPIIVSVDYGLKFAYGGSLLAIVDNPLDPPLEWNIVHATLATSTAYRPTKGVVVHEGYAHFYAELMRGAYPNPVVLFRVAVDGLRAPHENLEYLALDGSWKPASTWTAGDAFLVADEMAPSMKVHFHEGIDRWLTVQVDPTERSRMILQTAERLEGPWIRGDVVYEFPEMANNDPDDPQIACYAVTEHPQLRHEDGNKLVVTYSCNSTKGLLPDPDDLGLYYPKTLVLELDG